MAWSFLKPPDPRGSNGPGDKTALGQRHFNAVARHYDLANTIMSLGLHHLWKRRAVALLAPAPGQRILDLCGGTADLSLLIRRFQGPGRAGGMTLVYDLNRAMLERGRAKVGRRGRGAGISFLRGDAHRLALRSGSLDAVVVGFGVRNLARLEEGLREMARVLKPGGRLVCLEFCQPTSAWFGRVYDLYSCLIMPLVGRLLAGSWQTYAYLAGSIRAFPPPPELGRLITQAGFSRVSWRRLSGGIAAIHWAVKA